MKTRQSELKVLKDLKALKIYVDDIRKNYGCYDCVLHIEGKHTSKCWTEFIEYISFKLDKVIEENSK